MNSIKKHQKLFIAFICMAMCVGLLCGCSAGNGNDIPASSAPSAVPSEEPTEAPSAVPSEAPSEEPSEVPSEEPSEEPVAEGGKLPGSFPKQLAFSSGAGAWVTLITLNEDGSFTGEYSDTDAGDMADDYPNGTIYTSVFSGKFGSITQKDEFSYTMQLEEITCEKEPDTEWIEDGTRYIATRPNGFDGDSEYTYYLTGADVNNLPEAFLRWYTPYTMLGDDTMLTLPTDGIYNAGGDSGFFVY